MDFFYCQSQIENDKFCSKQCDHCKEYYKPLELKKFKCSKCGTIVESDDSIKYICCTEPFIHRTSGICGGAYEIID